MKNKNSGFIIKMFSLLKSSLPQNIPIERIAIKHCQIPRAFVQRQKDLIDTFFEYFLIKGIVHVKRIIILIHRKNRCILLIHIHRLRNPV